MPEVTDAQIASYEAVCESLARRFVGRNRAELDDLMQEGRIAVWQSLLRGITPSAEIIEYRMEDYVRWLGTQEGKRRYGEDDGPVPYEAMLPLDDISGALELDEYISSDFDNVEARLG